MREAQQRSRRREGGNCMLVAGAVSFLLLTPTHAFPRLEFAHNSTRKLQTNNVVQLTSGAEIRLLEEKGGGCSLCGKWSNVLADESPFYESSEDLPPGLTCQDWDDIVSAVSPLTRDCGVLQALFFPQCCNVTVNENVAPYECETAVHKALFEDKAYETSVPPITAAGGGYVNVSVSLEYFHLTELSTMEGSVEIYFGVGMNWEDERLAWDPSKFGGCHVSSMRASMDVEKTSIWVPDFDLLNRAIGMDTFKDSMADVTSNGHVGWYRLGGLKALCVFSGLEQFPYDELGCFLKFGSTVFPPRINYVLAGDGLSFPETHVANYQEYKVLPERSIVHKDHEGFYRFQFFFKRSSNYYTQTIVVPTILFTMLSFGMFLLDVRVGERLAFGVSLLLVIIAQAILTTGFLPVCSERLWVTTLTEGSKFWVLGALVESLLVACLFFMVTKEEKEREERGQVAEHEEKQQAAEHEEKGQAEEREAATVAVAVGSTSVALDDEQREEREEHVLPKDEESHVPSRGTSRMKSVVTLRQLLIQQPTPTHSWKMEAIRQMDLVCLVFFPISYIVFFSVMLATNKNW